MPIQYRPLESSRSEIRLLSLHPGSFAADIEVELSHVSLEEKPTYEALSYVWGKSSDQEEIIVSGTTALVTRNLGIALRYIRSEEAVRVLWVDALCINQMDTDEKNSQVRQMWRVFESATKVLAWLGLDEGEADEVFELIREIGLLMTKVLQEFALDDESTIVSPRGFRSLGFDVAIKPWVSFRKFMNNEYWQRIWIIQELFFAGSIETIEDIVDEADRCIVGYGKQWISRPAVTRAWWFWELCTRSIPAFTIDRARIAAGDRSAYEEPIRTLYIGALHASGMFMTLFNVADDYLKKRRIMILPGLIAATQDFEATDPRDRVYALLGMISWGRDKIPINYSKSVEAVLSDVVQVCLEWGDDLGILQKNPRTVPNQGISWLPEVGPTLYLGRSWKSRQHRASYPLKPAKPNFSVDGTILLIPGTEIGQIVAVMEPTLEAAAIVDPIEYSKKYSAAMQQWNDCISAEQQPTFWRSLILDESEQVRDESSYPADKDTMRRFASLFNKAPIPEDFEPHLPAGERRAQYTAPLMLHMNECMVNRCVFTLSDGSFGLGPYCSQVGDSVVILQGGNRSFVLRRAGEHYRLVGDAYVQGFMRGEIYAKDEQGFIRDVDQHGFKEFAIS